MKYKPMSNKTSLYFWRNVSFAIFLLPLNYGSGVDISCIKNNNKKKTYIKNKRGAC